MFDTEERTIDELREKNKILLKKLEILKRKNKLLKKSNNLLTSNILKILNY